MIINKITVKINNKMHNKTNYKKKNNKKKLLLKKNSRNNKIMYKLLAILYNNCIQQKIVKN